MLRGHQEQLEIRGKTIRPDSLGVSFFVIPYDRVTKSAWLPEASASSCWHVCVCKALTHYTMFSRVFPPVFQGEPKSTFLLTGSGVVIMVHMMLFDKFHLAKDLVQQSANGSKADHSHEDSQFYSRCHFPNAIRLIKNEPGYHIVSCSNNASDAPRLVSRS